MKGVVFNEFVQHIETKHGDELIDAVLVAAKLPHGGAYTRVGTYPFEEMLRLVGAYAEASRRDVPDILEGFGEHCFASWVNYRPAFFAPGRQLFDILEQIDSFHEYEVRKLYPDAELPSFVTETRDERVLVIGYHSSKNLTDLAIGVIKGAAAHLGQAIDIRAEEATGPSGHYTRLRIELTGTTDKKSEPARCPVLHRT